MPASILATLFFYISLLSIGQAAVIDETKMEIKTREIAKTLRCAVCQTENIWESGSPLAQQMRGVIQDRVRQGQSAEEIRAYFLSRYGDYILMEPPKRGLHWWIWLGPFILLVIGGYLLYRQLSRWVAHTSSSLSEEDLPPLDEKSRRRLEQEIHFDP